MKSFLDKMVDLDRAMAALKTVSNGVVNGDVGWRTMIYYVANVTDALEIVRDHAQKRNWDERRRIREQQ